MDPKPRLAKKTTPSEPSLSSDKGDTPPASTRQEEHDREREASSVDLFKNRKFVYGEKRIFPIKLPDVSSEEILAKKPWLGVKKSPKVEKQTETALTQKSQEKKDAVEDNPVEEDKAKEQENTRTDDNDNETEGDETKGENTYNKDDNGNDDKVDDEEAGRGSEPVSSLKKGTEVSETSLLYEEQET